MDQLLILFFSKIEILMMIEICFSGLIGAIDKYCRKISYNAKRVMPIVMLLFVNKCHFSNEDFGVDIGFLAHI